MWLTPYAKRRQRQKYVHPTAQLARRMATSRKTYWFIMGQYQIYDASIAGDVAVWIEFERFVHTRLSVIRRVHGGSQRTEDTDLAPELAEFHKIPQLGDGPYSRQEDRSPRRPPCRPPRRPPSAARRPPPAALDGRTP